MWHNVSRNLLSRFTKIRPSPKSLWTLKPVKLKMRWSLWWLRWQPAVPRVLLRACNTQRYQETLQEKGVTTAPSINRSSPGARRAEFGVALLFTQLQTQLRVTFTAVCYSHSYISHAQWQRRTPEVIFIMQTGPFLAPRSSDLLSRFI